MRTAGRGCRVTYNNNRRIVVQLEHVWFNAASARAGTHFRILQAQHSALDPPLGMHRPTFAVSGHRNRARRIRSHGCRTGYTGSYQARHLKYFRMLEVGIPRPCVEQKKCMQSLDPHVLDAPPGLPLPADADGEGTRRDGLFTEMTAARTPRKVTRDDTTTEENCE